MNEFKLIPPSIQKSNQNKAPISPSQEGLWFLHQLRPDSPAYNLIYLFKMIGGVDPEILKLSLDELVRRHEIFRTVYPIDKDGKPIQVIQPFESSGLIYVDFSLIEESEKEKALRAYAIEQGNKSYDLQKGPVARFSLLHTGPRKDYFLLAVHHISFDEWSRFVFIQDLLQLYEAYRSGNEPNLPSLPIQYADYVLWETKWLNGETRATYLQHWKNILSGDLPILALSTDRPRQAKQVHHAARYYFELPPSISVKLRKFSTKEGLTRFQVLLSAYAVLLLRYTGQEDIIIGCPFANRPLPEQDGMIGYFVNTLPIRLNLGGNPGVRNLLKQVHEAMADASTWKTLPFEALVAELAPQRDLGRAPIYQATINMLNMPRRQKSIPGLEIDLYFREQMLDDYDISIEFSDSGDHFTACLLYSMDLFDHSTMARMASHFQNLLEEMLNGPNRSLSELEILSSDERQQILFTWNETFKDYPHEKCVHQLFEEQVERTPDSPAIFFGEKQLTYRELNERANQIAHYLCKLGAGPKVPVGLFVERSADLVVAILGILKSGSPYVPLDTLYPLKRRTEIIRDSGMKILVTQDGLVTDEFGSDLSLLRLDGQYELLNAESKRNLLLSVKSENLVYIIYTSGSTGKPKGVEITHRNLVNCLLSSQERMGLTIGDYSLTLSTPTFDISVFEFLAPLCIGGSIAVASRDETFDGCLLANRIMELPLTWMFATPASWQMLRDAGWQGKPRLKILCGGEAFPPELAEWLMQTCGEVYNLYGPTEATIMCTTIRLTPGNQVTIGYPIANTSLYILDSYFKPVPMGVAGELYIGGDGLARGYHNYPELTDEKFLPNPFSHVPGERLYATGDLARYRLSGDVNVLGRIDYQVKIRGYRIELGEIETVIRQYPDVQHAVVVAREDRPGDKRLIAYIVMASGIVLNADNLRRYLQEKLPAYMVPAALTQLDVLPLTINGKVDFKALPAAAKVTFGNQEFIDPSNQTEQLLSKIWKDVLGIAQVRRDDNFFDIGGNSLLAIQVMTRIRHEFAIALPVQRIFESPRLSELAAQIDLARFYQKRSSGFQEGINDREESIL